MQEPLPSRPTSVGTLRDPVHFIAFGFGAGLAPKAPGTFGSLVGLLAALALFELPVPWRVAAVLAVIGAGIWICGESARRLQRHDDQRIVFDEISGVLLTSLVVAKPAVFALVLVFVLFRFFDIVKPWPIREADHSLSGGLGIMLDDIIAGIFAAAILLAAKLLI